MSTPNTGGTAARTSLLTAGLCFLIAIFEGFDLQAAGVAAPRLGPAFQMTPAELGWFFSSSTFGLMIGAAIGGRLSDLFGRKTVLIGSITVFGAMSILTAMSTNTDMLLWMRFLTGVGMGGALPNLVALTNENTPPHLKNSSVGLLYAGMPTGGALASFTAMFGGPEAWQIVFHVGGIAPLVAIPILLWALPESTQLAAAKQVHAGGNRGIGFALFGDGRALRTSLLWFAFFFALLTMYLLLNWLPKLLEAKGLARGDTFYVQMAFNLFGAMASITTGVLMDRLGLSKVVIVSFIATAVALFLLANVPPVVTTAVLIGALVGATISATQALLYAVAPNNYPTEVRGTGVGAAVTVGRLGSAAGPLLAASLIGAGWNAQGVLTMLVPVILIAGVAAFALVGLMRKKGL